MDPPQNEGEPAADADPPPEEVARRRDGFLNPLLRALGNDAFVRIEKLERAVVTALRTGAHACRACAALEGRLRALERAQKRNARIVYALLLIVVLVFVFVTLFGEEMKTWVWN